MERVVYSMLAVCLILTFTLPCWGAEVEVYPATLGSAIVNAGPGDSLILNAGTYTIYHTITKPLTLAARTKGDATVTCLNGYDYAFGVTSVAVKFVNIIFANCVQVALNFTSTGSGTNTVDSCEFNGNSGSAALAIRDAKVSIVDTKFFNNSFSVFAASCSFTMTRVIVDRSILNGAYAAIVGNTVNFTIVDSAFNNTSGFTNFAGAMYITNGEGTITNSTFASNKVSTSSAQGGAISLMNFKLELRKCTFIDNKALEGGAIYVGTGSSSLLMDSCTVSDTVTDTHAAIFAPNTPVQIYSSTFRNNVVITISGNTWPSVIHIESSSLTVTDSWFDRNTGGSTINLSNVTATISRSVFTNNHGHIFMTRSSLNVSYCRHTDNFATLNGGAFYVFSGSTFNWYHSTTLNNTSPMMGSTLFADGSSHINIYNVSINNSVRGGPAVYALNSFVVISNITVAGCGNTLYKAGGVAASQSTLDLSDSVFSGNTAGSGGGVYITNGNSRISNCKFSANNAQYGGGVGVEGIALVNITNSQFVGNTVTLYGGGIYSTGNAVVDVYNSSLTQNIAVEGGGIYGGSNSVTVRATDITYNLAIAGTAYGGGVYCFSQSMIIVSSRINNNTAYNGGGIYAYMGCKLSLTGGELIDNRANTQGGGLLGESCQPIQIKGTRFVTNHGPSGGGIKLVSTSIIIREASILNSVSQQGGGFHLTDTNVEITGSDISRNYAALKGGGLLVTVGPNFLIANTTMIDNYAIEADGIHVENPNTSALRMQGVMLSNNGTLSFCCNGVTLTDIHQKLCSFPACSRAQCRETTNNCECPFTTSGSYNPTQWLPILSYTNTTCTCPLGYTGTGGNCSIDNYCLVNSSACDSRTTCYAVYGTANYSCSACPSGFNGTGETGCQDINECADLTALCGAFSTCQNTIGNYTCICDQGYEGDGRICNEIDECTRGTAECKANSTCRNTPGSYACDCNPGFEGDGKINCEDINECSKRPAVCKANSTCHNTLGNYTCECNAGFQGDGKVNCSDINECDLHYCNSLVNCTNTVGNYTCTDCPKGYYGSGYANCTFIDVCHPNPCKANAICTELSGTSYNCTCMKGFTMRGTECIDINECDVNNGGCDRHVTCNNTQGSYNCPPCPLGMTGDSYNNCTSLCGNNVCEPLLGENCVSCFGDCKNITCGICGDGRCDVAKGENCTSCVEDCQNTPLCAIKCDKCVNGICNNKGVCICNDKWSGPACDVDNQVIDVDTNKTAPVVTITTNKTQTAFSIGILRIQEVSEKSEVVASVEMASGAQNFTFSGNLTKEQKQATIWSYGSTLKNKAMVNFTFFQFEDATNISFANQTLSFPPHSLKFNVNISSWPFQNIKNSLAVVLESYGTQTDGGNICGAENSFTNSGDVNHLQWVKVTHQGITLYGQFSDAAVVDGRYRNIKFSLNQTNNLVSAVLPHFWNNAEFDPSYSVLIGVRTNSDECSEIGGSSGTSKALVIGVSAGVVGCALVVAAVGTAIFVRKRRNILKRTKSPSKIPLQERSNDHDTL